MVLTGAIDQLEVYQIVGETGNLRTIALLIGMMLIFHYFEREGLVEKSISLLLKVCKRK